MWKLAYLLISAPNSTHPRANGSAVPMFNPTGRTQIHPQAGARVFIGIAGSSSEPSSTSASASSSPTSEPAFDARIAFHQSSRSQFHLSSL